MAETATAQIISVNENAGGTTVTTPERRRRKRTSKKSAKDYVIDYLLQGHSALTEAVSRGEINKMKAKQIVDTLTQQGHDAALLQQSFGKLLTGGHGRGRTPAAVGERRSYRAQQISDDDHVFARIPLATLGVAKGGQISVSFERDRLVITKV